MFSFAKAKWPTQSNVSAGFLVDYVESEDEGGAATSNRVIPGTPSTSYVRSTNSSSLRLGILYCIYCIYKYIRSILSYTPEYLCIYR